MKVLMANYPWIGGIAHSIEEAFKDLGHEVSHILYHEPFKFFRKLKLTQIKYIDKKLIGNAKKNFNHELLKLLSDIKPDLFFVFNEANIYPETVSEIKKCGVRTVVLIGDDPFDSFRFSFLPYSLKFFDYIFVCEKLWIPDIRKVAPHSQVYKTIVGYNPKIFNRENSTAVISQVKDALTFTGESYGERGEGGYRSSILSHLTDYNLRIWGDKGWQNPFRYYPELKKCYMGDRLPIDKLIYLYQNSLITLNMPSPQLRTTFQPRVFEIASCGGFQIVDRRDDIFEVFSEEEIISFSSIDQLKEIIEYFYRNPKEREKYILAGLKSINGNTWLDRVRHFMEIIHN